MLLKIAIILLLMIIIYSLGSALFFMFRDGESSVRMVKALSWRVGLSVALFGLLFFSYWMGWIAPHSIVAQV